MGRDGRSVRRALTSRSVRWSIGFGCVGGVVSWFALRDIPLGYDPTWNSLWGREIVDGFRPSYEAREAPTPHPLFVAATVPIWAVGGAALVHASLKVAASAAFGVLVAATHWLGCRVGGRAVGAASAVLIGTSVTVIREIGIAAQDIGFVALTTTAACLLAGRRPPVAALGLLGLAGLLRPEAWVLGALVAAWHGYTRRRIVPLEVGLVAVAPLLWLLSDLVVAGSLTHSFDQTSSRTNSANDPTGLGEVPRATFGAFVEALEPAGVVAAGVGLVLLWRQRHPLRGLLTVPASCAVLGMFVLGSTGLPLIARYVLFSVPLLAVAAAHAIVGWVDADGPASGWRAFGAAFVVATVVLVPARITRNADALDEHFALRRSGSLGLDAAATRAVAIGCDPILLSFDFRALAAFETDEPLDRFVAAPPGRLAMVDPAAVEAVEAHGTIWLIEQGADSPPACILRQADHQ